MNSELSSEHFSATFGYSAAAWKARVTEIVDALSSSKQAKAVS
jgi:hypothetical protein